MRGREPEHFPVFRLPHRRSPMLAYSEASISERPAFGETCSDGVLRISFRSTHFEVMTTKTRRPLADRASAAPLPTRDTQRKSRRKHRTMSKARKTMVPEEGVEPTPYYLPLAFE